ncbi:MAG: S41 family peptidase [Chloroherpetonaceae bacterium]|nr:S41 family peptidase [Chthonomonadaceae bacterium]MDW8207526.1 S41 family peptidase [Chloroherpetonaceae bacterium]
MIAFSYHGDLWIVPSDGGTARRLTIHEAHDQLPSWSPDGRWIAFSSRRDGNYDVFLIPAESGRARQLTFHSADDLVGGWSPDGKEVLFTSSRETTRTSSIYAVNVVTGSTRRIATDDFALAHPVFTPNGTAVAATRGGSWTRRGYRGSGNANLVQYPATGGPGTWLAREPENERYPLFSPDGQTLYFVCDRGDAANIWRKPAGGKATPLTRFQNGNIFYPTIDRSGTRIVFEREFALWSLDIRREQAKRIDIFAPTDERTNNLRRETYRNNVQEVALSPDGKTLALVVHGEIFLQPVSGGETTRLTETPQREQDVAWSPDGTRLAFASDRTGDSDLYVADVKTRQARALTTTAGIAEHSPAFSPDGQLIAFLRGYNGAELCVMPAAGGAFRCLLKDPSLRNIAWSPDSRWIACERLKSHSAGSLSDLFLISVDTGTVHNLTRYPVLNSSPVWSSDATRIFFLSDRTGNTNLYSISLQEEKDQEDTERNESGTAHPSPKKPVQVALDLPDIHRRARQVTRVEGNISGFALSPDAKTLVFALSQAGRTDLWRIAADGETPPVRLTQSGAESGTALQFTQDGARVLYLAEGSVRSLTLNASAVTPITVIARMDVDTRLEMLQLFDEAWRKMRDGFYDPQMHGVDWNAVKARYRPVVEDIAAREDFYVLFNLALGELNASHTGIAPPASRAPEGPATASLGVEFDDTYHGRGVRIRSVMPKGPADREESRLKPGDIILKIDGKPVEGNERVYLQLADRAGKRLELLVNTEAREEGARTVRIRAITQAAYRQLEYERWQKERATTVERLSTGRVGYLHLNAMGPEQLEKFRREVFGDLQSCEGLILDLRFNSGGSIADEILAILQDRVFAYRTLRDDPVRSTAPLKAWNKPVVVLINEASFSNAEVFPWGVKELKLGRVVGTPTFGGVIGTGSTTLIDGSTLRIPAVGTYTLGGINQENNGCPPDILVENTLEDCYNSRDRQLERAVEEILKVIPRSAAVSSNRSLHCTPDKEESPAPSGAGGSMTCIYSESRSGAVPIWVMMYSPSIFSNT